MKKKILAIGLALIMAVFVVPVSLADAKTESDIVLPEGINWTEGSTVYYDGEYYKTLVDALKAVYMSSPKDVSKVYCKPGADVGHMTHGHVADDLILYGNDAYVSGGEHDLEVDTYKYSRETGAQSNDGEYLTKDITIKAYDLNGIAVWSQRNTNHTINVLFESCENIQRMYITGTTGPVNYTVNSCTFDATKGSHQNTSIYSNAPGNIVVKDTSFTAVGLGINLNNKSNGVQNVSLVNCQFNDCAGEELSKKIGSTTYGAPVRIVAQKDATSNLSLDSVEFNYSEGFKCIAENGDILIGDGRHNGDTPGKTTVSTKETTAVLSLQEPGYYDSNGAATDPTLCKVIEFEESENVNLDESGNVEINCAHNNTSVENAKDATCTNEGYTGDKVCKDCNEIIEKGQIITKLNHNYVDGKCDICGAADPSYNNPPAVDDTTDKDTTDNTTAEKDDTVKTGDEVNLMLLLALLIASGASFTLLFKVRKNDK